MKRYKSYRKSKFNLMLTFIALALLLISLLTMTYCWIEGSTQIQILNESGADILIKGTSNQNTASLDEDNNGIIDLSNYIDNLDSLYLAPAQMNNGTLQIKDGNTFRNATTNDIGNNYIEFDVKIKVSKEHKFKFTDDSEITVGGNKDNPIRVALKLDDKPITTIFSSKLENTTDSNTETNRDAFIVSDKSVHNLKVIIWYDDSTAKSKSFNGEGQTVNFNFELESINNCVSLEFVDRTTNTTNNNLTVSSGSMKVAVNGTEYNMTKNTNTNYVYNSAKEIPISALNAGTIEFRYYNSSNALQSKWSASATTIARRVYTAYGALSTSGATGTWNDVVAVNFVDNSIDKSFNTGSNHVTVYNGIDSSYNMYHNTADDIWTAFVPIETFTENKSLCFNSRNNSSNSINFSETTYGEVITAPSNPTYSVYGSSGEQGEYKDTSYVGKWCNGFDAIAVRSYDSTISAVSGDFWVSFDNWQTKYKAVKNSTGRWSFNVPNDTVRPLNFEIGTYKFDGKDRTKTGSEYIYTIESTTVGTWAGTVPMRKVTVENAPYAVVTATYKNSTGGNVTIAEGQTADVPEDTVLTLNAQTATGISASAINGHQFTKFTVNTTDYTKNNSTVTVGNVDLTIKTTTTPYDFYIGGSGLKDFDSWDVSKKMTYNSSTNSVTCDIVNTSATGNKIKISEIGFSSSYRDNPTYSVTLNNPTVQKSGSVSSVSITGEGNDRVLEFSATVNSTITVTYKLDTNTITLAGTAPQINTVYLRNSAGWSTQKVHYWKNGGGDGTTWPGADMTNVSGNIWKIEIPTAYDRVQFNQGNSTNQSDNLTIYNNYIYDNSAKTWKEYDPSAPVSSDYYLRGTLTDWTTGNQMTYQSGSSTIVETTVSLTANTTYQMKIYYNGTWYTNNTTVTGSCTNLDFSTEGGSNNNFNFKPTSSGTYKFSFDTSAKKITIQKQ